MVETGTAALIINILTGFVLILILIAGIVLILMRQRRPKIERDTSVINLMSDKANGHAEGIERKVREHPSGRLICSFYPTDITQEEISRQGGWKPVTVVVDKGRRIVIPKGTLSAKRNVVFYLPKHDEQIHSFFGSGNVLASGFSKAAGIQSDINLFFSFFKERFDRIENLVTEFAGGEISADFMEWFKEAVQKAVLDKLEGDDKKDSGKKKAKKDSFDLN